MSSQPWLYSCCVVGVQLNSWKGCFGVTVETSVRGVYFRAMFQSCIAVGVHGPLRGCSNCIFMFDALGHCEDWCSQAVDGGE